MARVAFIQYFWMEKLGLMYISAVLKKYGHQTIVCMNNKKEIKQKLRDFKPDIVGFYCVSGAQKWIKNIASFIKKEVDSNILVVVGGPHPTFSPEFIEAKEVDIICRGEGEYPMLDLANKLDDKEDITGIKNLYIKIKGKIFRNSMRSLLQDIDEFPFPDRELYRDYDYIFNSPYYHFLTSRGCSYSCTFCYNDAFRKMQESGLKYVRRRSVENIIKELLACKLKHKFKSVIFLDDDFGLADRSWIDSFLDRYKTEIGLPFFCETRANLLTEWFVKRLKESGCHWVEMGVESGNEKYRNELLKKDLKDSQIIDAAKLLHKYKLNFDTTNMIGLPNESVEEAIETLRFNAKLKPSVAWCSIFQPYPNTTMGEYCLRNNLIDKTGLDSIDIRFHDKSILMQPGIEEITNLHKFAHVAVKFPNLVPLIRILIKLPPNRLFRYFHRLTYLIYYWSTLNKITVKRIYQELIIAFRYYRDV